MRRANRLARFHMVSTDGRKWVNAETLASVFGSDASDGTAGYPGASWFYAVGRRAVGPVTAEDLQALIDRGDLRSDSLVRRDNEAQWSVCHQVGEFRFTPLPAAPT